MILKIESFDLEVPFKGRFKHNSKSRDRTESFFVMLVSKSGYTSFGEGCPRVYVTGETLDSCGHFLDDFRSKILKVLSLEDLNQLIAKYSKEISKNPSAWCAIEMAILDTLAKEDSVSVEKLLALNSPLGSHTVSAVLGIDSYFNFLKKLIKYRLYGLTDFKIKLSGNVFKDKFFLYLIKLSGISKDNIRLDANNLWASKEEAIPYLRPLSNLFWAIEEPLKSFDFKEFQELSIELKKKIILDESFLNMEDFKNIEKKEKYFIVNLRISKMGGILRSIQLIKLLDKNKIKIILGSHVGETSLLTRASLLIMENFSKNIDAFEGAYSSHLLKTDPARPNIKFGRRGVLWTEELNLSSAGFSMDFTKDINSKDMKDDKNKKRD